ncbi:hypothetical protein KIP69_14615 [Geobacter sulfurreducens]|jgi:rubrerythrin|uniref:Rubrerythrin diiron-binding domain-containing protein n=1 Tax=Geobacter sulfurreducens (strain ATCC 51573 / DSM 12127 / PCA) TaxID=243231 RepID=Q748J8_GEOSL|nr:hypothetical protein [Geobacter sulfurreducens]AAR36395.1 hypothetical protein GSU3003 [Geobacter sulfurreducens PCA]ADI85758.1 hypothetical protein KN400_2946 [Geobacter sulfurreducens KN400]AJY69254.1 hypothetical protein RW64_06360 [Geobacter sulfurreducens]QVW34811.1 hypothetical protein KIP69_14615 [Geobacter sulfurreducens]UAC03679.1 hypothetical protein KVP06_15090 [Geobacter sulfurreducens]
MTILETSWVQGNDREIEELVRLVNEAIALELNASRLYALFQDLFPDDGEFWQTLSIEEENHANLLRNGRRLFLPEGRFPRELLPESLEPLVEKNRELETLFDRYEQTPPSREEAFRTALVLEESAGELHFQRAMESRAPSWTLKVFQTLNNDDRDHANRLRDYMAAKGIAE